MTKTELEKEATQYALEWGEKTDGTYACCRDAYLASAEPREKQIEIDAEHIRTLQKQNGELTDKVKELEAQIEKMKCCQNCKHYTSFNGACMEHGYFSCNKKDWEIKENE